jgi:hypothetical protein
VGIRLNRNPPNISFRKKKTGGIAINRLLPLTHLDEKMVQRILQVRLPVLTLLCAWGATCTANSTAPTASSSSYACPPFLLRRSPASTTAA